MDCSETRKKLSRLADNLLETQEESALREHLDQCPDCARLLEIEKLLADDLKQMRTIQPPRPVGIEQVREEITIRDRQYRETNLGVRIMQQISQTINTRPRLSLAAAAIVVLLVASVLVPVRTETPVGYEVAFAAPSGGFVLNQRSAEHILAALDIPAARIETSEADSGVVYRISRLKDSTQVKRLIAVLDSLGGQRVRSLMKKDKPEDRTIWHLILNEDQEGSGPSSAGLRDKPRTITLNLKKMLKDDFVLWMPLGDQTGDSLQGLLMERKNEKTNIQLVGVPPESMTNDCGLSQFLNGNTVMNTTMPDGEKVSLDLTNIEDVRRLERAGYNFVLMEFDTPGQVPIPGMGPKLNEIDPNPFKDKTVIEYMIPQAYEVRLQILDERGMLVRSLLDCIAIAGIRHVVWDGLDDDGEAVASGIYQCRFVAGDYSETRRITLGR